jgi:hypothetical protein
MRITRFVRHAVCIGALLALTSTVYALSSVQATIIELMITEGDQYARMAVGTTEITDRPTCHAAGYINHYGFDLSTAKGKAILTTATAAMLAGRRIGVVGSGTCVPVSPNLTLESVGALILYP